MSDDIVVTVPAGGGNYSLEPVAEVGGGIVGGPPPWAAPALDLDTPAFYNRTLPQVAEALKSSESESDKLADALNWFRTCLLMNKCKVEGYSNSQYLVSQYHKRASFSMNDAPPQLSNSPYAIISAMANYLWGNGRTMSVGIDTLALQYIKPDAIPGFSDRMNSVGEPGQHNLSFSFPYDTGGSNVFMNYILGNITLDLDGVFTRNATGGWGFEGVVRAHMPDRYNFNSSNHRTEANENLTTIGRWMGQHFNGQPYQIDIIGETQVKF